MDTLHHFNVGEIFQANPCSVDAQLEMELQLLAPKETSQIKTWHLIVVI